MSFAGHVFDMIKRSEANRAQLRKHREQAAKLRSMYVGTDPGGRQTTEKSIPPEQLAAIRQQIREHARRERRKRAVAIVIAVAAGAGIVAYLTYIYLNL